MALRRFSKYMKFVTVIVILSFVLTAAFAGYQYISAALSQRKQVLFTLNGDKIYKEDYMAELNNLKSTIEEKQKQVNPNNDEKFIKIPEKIIEEMALSSTINKSLYVTLSRNMKIEVGNSDVNAKMKELENMYGGKETLSLILGQRGLTIADLKKEIKSNLIYEKTIEKIKQKIRPTDKQLEELYNRFKYSEFDSRSFAEAKEDVAELYYKQNIDYILSSNIEQLFVESKLETKDENIKKMFEELKKEAVVLGDYKITRKDMLPDYVVKALTNEKGYYEALEKDVNEEKKVALNELKQRAEKAKALGIKGLDNLTAINYDQNVLQNYYYYLVDKYEPSEDEMKAWFEQYKSRYEIPNTVSGEVFGMKYKATKDDIAKTNEKVKELMKTINKDNFAQKAKELSKDPGSAQNGGDLGMNDIRGYVAEFSKALANAKEGSIIGPVDTEYGTHIIYVKKVDKDNHNMMDLSHILITPEISEATKQEAQKEVRQIKDQIVQGKLTWEQIAKDTTGKYSKFDIKEQFSKTEKNSSLPVIGYDAKINEELFNLSVGGVMEKEFDDTFVFIHKTQEIPYEAPTYEKYKDRVKTELKFYHANLENNK